MTTSKNSVSEHLLQAFTELDPPHPGESMDESTARIFYAGANAMGDAVMSEFVLVPADWSNPPEQLRVEPEEAHHTPVSIRGVKPTNPRNDRAEMKARVELLKQVISDRDATFQITLKKFAELAYKAGAVTDIPELSGSDLSEAWRARLRDLFCKHSWQLHRRRWRITTSEDSDFFWFRRG